MSLTPVARRLPALILVTVLVAACGGGSTPSGTRSPGGSASGTGNPTGTRATETTAGRTATSRPSATRSPSPRPSATPDRRFEGLEPCPNKQPCYLYEVARGDTLSKIASRFDTTVRKILAINPEIDDPASIRIGQVIKLPTR
jgi:peptidoglycan DL-endopeptidase LytE